MNILMTGATGFLGQHLANHLAGLGHHIVACTRRKPAGNNSRKGWDWQPCDFSRDITTEDWLPRLEGIDLVINAVGIFQGDDAGSLTEVQTLAPQALFRACARLGIWTLQISAQGADRETPIAFLASKREADQLLQTLPQDSIIVHPAVVVGPGGKSTKALSQLAALPIVPTVGNGMQALNPVHISDFCSIIGNLVTQGPAGKCRYQISGPPLTMRELMGQLRRRMGMPATGFLVVPVSALRLAARIRPRGLLTPDGLRLLTEVAPSPSDFPVRPLEEALFANCLPPVSRADATLAALRPAIVASLLTVWVFTGLTSLFWARPEGYALLAAGGIRGPMATLAINAGGIADLLLGLLLLTRHQKAALASQLMLMVTYTVAIGFIVPRAWLHPFGPVTKNLPMAVLTLIAWMTAET